MIFDVARRAGAVLRSQAGVLRTAAHMVAWAFAGHPEAAPRWRRPDGPAAARGGARIIDGVDAIDAGGAGAIGACFAVSLRRRDFSISNQGNP